MSKLLFILTLLVSLAHAQIYCDKGQECPAGGGGGGTFTLSHTVADRAAYSNKLVCSGSSCTLTVPAPTSGHAATIHIVDSGGAGSILSSVSSTGETWVVPAGCKVSSGPVGDMAAAYTLSTGTSTTITITLTQAFSDTVVIYREYAWSGSSVSFDTCATATSGGSGTTATGPTRTMAGGTELSNTMMGLSATPSSITVGGSYTDLVKQNDASTTLAFAAGANWLNTSSSTAVVYTLGSAENWIISDMVLKGN